MLYRRSMWTKSLIFAAALLFLTPAHAAYPQPEGYRIPELRLRADSGPALNIPSATYFGLEDPLFFDNQDIVLKFLSYAGEARSGFLRWSSETGLQTHFTPVGTFPTGLSSDPTSGAIVFEQINYGYFSEGVMALSHNFDKLHRLFFDKTYIFTGSPQMVPAAQQVLVRELLNDGTQGLSFVGNAGAREVLGTSPRNPGFPYSYLFRHSVHPNGFATLKVRHGEAGEIAETQGDEILLIDFRQEPPLFQSLLRDHDLDPRSPFAGFDNSGDINASGNVAWIARRPNGKRALIHSSPQGQTRVLVEEGLAEIAEFSYFHVSLNDLDQVAFRATDTSGKQGIWISDINGRLQRILTEGDRLKTDKGPARIGVGGTSPKTFYGSPKLNAKGDLLMGAFLTTEMTPQTDIGLGFFLVEPYPLRP
jgi:hypothetical protein